MVHSSGGVVGPGPPSSWGHACIRPRGLIRLLPTTSGVAGRTSSGEAWGWIVGCLGPCEHGQAEWRAGRAGLGRGVLERNSYLVDPASSHMLVSKIKPCMCKYKLFCTVKLRMAH